MKGVLFYAVDVALELVMTAVALELVMTAVSTSGRSLLKP
jgi:hypothetical protein